MFFDKVISTENLYMAEIQVCLQTCISGSDNLFNTTDYVLVKPLNRNWHLDTSYSQTFVDVLTNARYDFQSVGFFEKQMYIRNLVPCTTNRKYITETEAKQILQHKNPVFLDLTSINKKEILNISGVSTKNLYMAELQKCTEACSGYSRNFFQKKSFVLVKPLKYNLYLDDPNIKKFVDVLTNTRYVFQSAGFSQGTVYIGDFFPFTNDKNYIMPKETTKILQEQNPTFLDLTPKMGKSNVFTKKY